MDYRPKYAQPFTLQEAVVMDVSVLTEGFQLTPSALTAMPIAPFQR